MKMKNVQHFTIFSKRLSPLWFCFRGTAALLLCFLFGCTLNWNEKLVHKSYRYTLSVEEVPVEMALNRTGSFSFRICNEESYAQRFYLSADQANGFGLDFPQIVDVDGNGSRDVNVTVSPAAKGEWEGVLYIVGGESFRPVKRSISISLHVTKPAQLSVTGTTQWYLPVNQRHFHSIRIDNQSELEDSYDLFLTAYGVESSIEKTECRIAPGKYEEIRCESLLPGVQEGQIQILVRSQNDPSVQESLTVHFYPEDVQFLLEAESQLYLPVGVSSSFSFCVKNLTDREDRCLLSIQAENGRGSLSKSVVQLKGGAHESVMVDAVLEAEPGGVLILTGVSQSNPSMKFSVEIALLAVEAGFTVEAPESYYVKGQAGEIQITLKNEVARADVISLRLEGVPSYVEMETKATSVALVANGSLTVSLPYVVNADRESEIRLELVAVSGNVNRVQRSISVVLWDVTAKMVSLAESEDVRSRIDLRSQTRSLQAAFRQGNYAAVQEESQELLERLADYAGVAHPEPENELYFVDSQEPEVKIPVPEKPNIFSKETGNFRIVATEFPVSGACDQGGNSLGKNLFDTGENVFYLQKDGQPYVPKKKFVKGAPLLYEGKERRISYFVHSKTIFVRRMENTGSGTIKIESDWEFHGRVMEEIGDYHGVKVKETRSPNKEDPYVTSVTYDLYRYYDAILFEVTEESDSSLGFLSELGNTPTKRLVIFTHGTLFYKWVIDAKQHGDSYLFCSDGGANTERFFQQSDVAQALHLDYAAGDKAYYFNWSGENSYSHRDQAAEALEKFIYTQVAKNLYYCNASQVILIGHSHGVTVNNITMRNLDTEKMSKFAGEIPFVIGLNGVGENSICKAECFIFPKKTFVSLDGKDVPMYNFYHGDDSIVPSAYNQSIILPYNQEWEYIVQKTLSFLCPPMSLIFACAEAGIGVSSAILKEEDSEKRSESRKISGGINKNLTHFIESSSLEKFYNKHVFFHSPFNYLDMILSMHISLVSVSWLPNFFFMFGVNGIYEHQLTRIHKAFIRCVEKVDKNLLEDKIVNFKTEENE